MRNLAIDFKQQKMRRTLWITALLLISFFQFGNAQITGKVQDSKGSPAFDVKVEVKGQPNISTRTDDLGVFELKEAKEGDKLIFTDYDGSVEQTAKNNMVVKIATSVPATKETELADVVVIGYGKQRAEAVSGSVSSVKATAIQDMPQVSADQMLQGRASGINVVNNSGQPGSSVSIRIRGNTSLTGSNEPLYIIDGVPVSGDATNSTTSGKPIAGDNFSNQGNIAVSPLAMLNPNDIESMDILKDASATAIYGSRGANGVVIITTKSGKKGTGKLSFDYYYALQEIPKTLNLMNLRQYATLQNKLAEAFGTTPRVEFTHPELLGNGTDWQDEMMRIAPMQNYQVAYSGGKDGINYFFSGGYLDQTGTVIGTNFKRMNIKSNIDAKINNWLKAGLNLNGSITNERLSLNYNQQSLITTALIQAPDVSVRDSDGNFVGPPANSSSISYINPVALALSKTNKLERKNFMGNFYTEINFFKGLTYRFELGGNLEYSRNDEFTPSYQWGSSKLESPTLNVRRQNWDYWILKNLLTYDRTFGNHGITLLLAQEAQETRWEGVTINATGFLSNEIHNIGAAPADQIKSTGYQGSSAMESFFGRVLYSYDKKYNLSASYRMDGSSKFDSGHKWGKFAAVSVAWNVYKEPFMEKVNEYVDNIKLKAGFGQTGNQNIPNYKYGSALGATNTGLGLGFLISNYPNPNLKWETMEQTNIGMDFTLFKALNFTVEVYDKTSKNFLYKVDLPRFLTGAPYRGEMEAPMMNIGSMQNRGIDLTINYSKRFGNDLDWNSTLTVSHYKNKVKKLLNNDMNIFKETNTNGYFFYRYQYNCR